MVARCRDSIRAAYRSPDGASMAFGTVRAVLDEPGFHSCLVDSFLTVIRIQAGELTGDIPPKHAPDFLGAAARGYDGRIEIPERPLPGTPVDEANETNPGIRLLRGLERVVGLAVNSVSPDPGEFRRAVFGELGQDLNDRLCGDGI